MMKTRFRTTLLFTMMIVSLSSSILFAQDDEVILLEEILIKVEAELPTVMVTIARQEPVIESGELARPLENLLVESTEGVKPTTSEFEIGKVEEPQKMLAKVREP